jgi:GTPase SAR1 family protein
MSVDFSYSNVSHKPLLKPMALAALWRSRAAKEMRHWQQWIEQESLLQDGVVDLLSFVQTKLNKSRYTVAIVGDVSRGKSELINAMLFAQFGQRVAPSGTGHTLACPLEFFCDEDLPPFLELLPIETLLDATPLIKRLNNSQDWQKIELPSDDGAAIAQQLLKACAYKKIPREQAALLGFGSAGADNTVFVDVPVWRYVRMNMRHPLLTTGLSVLDTTGFNAVGSQAQSSREALACVDAVIYVLAADSAVARSDQVIWDEQLIHLPTSSKMAVINKTDGLNDGMRSALEIRTDVLQQVERTAKLFKLPKNQVFAVSARTGLLARLTKDDVLLEQSRLSILEHSLNHHLLNVRQSQLEKSVFDALEGSYRLCIRELKESKLQNHTQLAELENLSASKNPEKTIEIYASETQKRQLQANSLAQTIAQAMLVYRTTLLEFVSFETVQKSFENLLASSKHDSAINLRKQLASTIASARQQLVFTVAESVKAQASIDRAMKKVNKLMGLSETTIAATMTHVPTALNLDVALIEFDSLAINSSAQMPSVMLVGATQSSRAGNANNGW